MPTRRVAVYLSEHGFGHAVRSMLVLERLVARRPEVELRLATRLPAWLHRGLARSVREEAMALEPPLVQRDSVAVDHEASLALLDAQGQSWDAVIARHAAWLRTIDAALVYADMPPLPIAAARQVGVPAVALGNFTWSWIYRHYGRIDPRYLVAARRAERALGAATTVLALPTFPDDSAAPAPVRLPWVARAPSREPTEVRAALGIVDDRPLVLLSFGGHAGLGLEALAESAWARGVHLLAGRQLASAARGVHALDEDGLEEQGVRYIDVVGAADVVVSKPGYGILADCLAAGSRLVSLARPEFPEAPLLLEPAMRELLGAVTVPVEQRDAAGIIDAVARALRCPRPEPAVSLDGADRAVDEIEALLERVVGSP